MNISFIDLMEPKDAQTTTIKGIVPNTWGQEVSQEKQAILLLNGRDFIEGDLIAWVPNDCTLDSDSDLVRYTSTGEAHETNPHLGEISGINSAACANCPCGGAKELSYLKCNIHNPEISIGLLQYARDITKVLIQKFRRSLFK